jgi:hypothetical protein
VNSLLTDLASAKLQDRLSALYLLYVLYVKDKINYEHNAEYVQY